MLLSIINLVWILGLTIFSLWFFNHYRRLIKNSNEKDLKKVLDAILDSQTRNKKDISELISQVNILKLDGLSHIQKMGLIRFNPFNETGGNNSFTLSLLDGSGTGAVITGLHARNTTRFYVKSVDKGKSKYELSKEEQKSVDLALKK